MMRAPGFWWRSPGLEARLLQPLGELYGAVAARRMQRHGLRSAVPVFCVGNFVAGGSGKTPFAIELAHRLIRMGERPAFLTRGYGGTRRGPVLVDAAEHGAREIGDEAVLLARHAPTVVARARDAGARLAESAGATAIVMDDGLQNPSLAKDLSFATVDAEIGIGNALCLPAGPMRAPLAAQWRFVQALVTVGVPGPGCRALIDEAARRELAVIRVSFVPDPAAAEALHGRAVVAFAGIGRPEKFFASLRASGAVIVSAHRFADHQRFKPEELAALLAKARAQDALLVTTEKDMARIREIEIARIEDAALASELASLRDRASCDVGPAFETRLREFPVRLRIEGEEGLDKLVARALFIRRGLSARGTKA
jgi:tetraacyldisaccharide 4'-kinase